MIIGTILSWIGRGFGPRTLLQLGAAIAAVLCALPAVASEPLPRRTDIPADFSTVVCPSEAAALRMLREFNNVAPGSPPGSWSDTGLFMRGLVATGCAQRSGPLEIVAVIERKRVVPVDGGDYIAYRALNPAGEVVYGTIHERGNDQHPRTPHEQWMRLHAPEGTVRANTERRRTFVCRTPDDAIKVVAAIPELRESERGRNAVRQIRAWEAALRANGCSRVPGNGLYRVERVHNTVFISIGYEAGEAWTALTAVDARGQRVGLLYDANMQ